MVNVKKRQRISFFLFLKHFLPFGSLHFIVIINCLFSNVRVYAYYNRANHFRQHYNDTKADLVSLVIINASSLFLSYEQLIY